jgi:hypothetical protein
MGAPLRVRQPGGPELVEQANERARLASRTIIPITSYSPVIRA